MYKSEYMLIGSRQRLAGIDSEPIINIEGKNLRHVSKTKSLGIFIDENLNWNAQTDNISKKASKGIDISRRAKKYIAQQSLLQWRSQGHDFWEGGKVRVPKARAILGGSGGMLPLDILKYRVPQKRFPAFCG